MVKIDQAQISSLMRQITIADDIVCRLHECAESGADPTKWDYISLMIEAADNIESMQGAVRLLCNTADVLMASLNNKTIAEDQEARDAQGTGRPARTD